MSIHQAEFSMKRSALASLIALAMIGVVLPSVSAGEEEMPSAFGHYQISISDEPTRTIDFNARLERDGSTAGEMAFQDSRSVLGPKANSDVDSQDASRPFFVKANFDCLTVKGNKAVMGGTITEASLERYLGRRVLLVVQDNGHGVDPAKRDKLTWGLYRVAAAETLLTTDFERSDDQGSVPWLATDAERDDDAGMLSQKSPEIGCSSFPLSAFSFIDAREGRGNVQVRSGTTPQQVH